MKATPTSVENSALPVPLGARHLVVAPESGDTGLPVSYSDALQMNVSADGNPWHALASVLPETRTETNNGDGSSGGSDSGTDLW